MFLNPFLTTNGVWIGNCTEFIVQEMKLSILEIHPDILYFSSRTRTTILIKYFLL